jgi:hypothetical protein
METLETFGTHEKNFRFSCDICEYKTNKKSSYDNHKLSSKHKNYAKLAQRAEKLCPNHKCSKCDKTFTNRSGLWKHKKKCLSYQQNMDNNLTDIMMKVIEHNQKLENKINELTKLNTINNTINNGTINHGTINNKFNLNFYLNETCKNAINMSDFVNSLPVTIDDLEETARLGYAAGISKIFINGLKKVEDHDRPVHCSDIKREILYIKDNNQWIKDTHDKVNLTNIIKKIANKNINLLTEWKKLNPDYKNPESKQNDKYNKIICGAISGSSKEESEINYEKIIRNIVRETAIDK